MKEHGVRTIVRNRDDIVSGYKCACGWNPAGPLQVQFDALMLHVKEKTDQATNRNRQWDCA